jgi:gliding motility-associated-like protein
MGYNFALEHQFFPSRNRDEFQRVILKPAANDNYPFENGAHIRDAYVHMLSHLGDLHLDERTNLSCVLYKNGQYWGVYEIREKVDDADFLDHYYGQDEKFSGSDDYIQFLKTWGGTWSEYGNAPAQNDWNALRSYITSNSMAVQANFDYVDSLFNWKSLVDYFVLNSVVVTSDWLNWNTAWWRGLDPTGDKQKWRYALWDMDATFGHYINYTGIPSTAPTADPCNVENLPDPGGQGHTEVITELMDNPGFEQYYISRYIDLNNTVFSCPNMQSLLDDMIATIQPEMQGQVTKWGGTVAQWQANVQTLKDYIDTRCVALNTGLVNCYNLTGPYNLTINVDPPNSGWVDINSIGQLDTYPWTATYFGGIDILLGETPDVANGWEFDYWEVQSGGTLTPSTDSANVTLRIIGNETVIAHFKTPTGGFLPTAFSPNGDGLNDYLHLLLGEGIISMNFTAYNRWGETVVNLTNPAESWDGTYKGAPCPAGVYAYKLFVVLKDGEEVNQSGNITLIR